MGITMLFGDEDTLRIDLGDLESEKENLSNFLQTHLHIKITEKRGKLTVDIREVAAKELQQKVTKVHLPQKPKWHPLDFPKKKCCKNQEIPAF